MESCSTPNLVHFNSPRPVWFVGLHSLADRYPREVLETICQQFMSCKLNGETKVKVGEVMTKVTRQIGK